MEDENYFFDIREETDSDKVFVLIIYDITDNKKRNKLAKMLLGYGFRVQKSAFEAVIAKQKYAELLTKIPAFVSREDSVKVYKIIGRGQVTSFGSSVETMQDDVIII